jgi:hypothetical protein
MSDRRRKNDQLAHLLPIGFALALIFIVPVCAGGEKTGKHLFVLSGQSNMTGAVKAAFTAHVDERYGKENTVVVMRMKSGRGIRFWLADYDQPADRGLTEKKMTSNGQEYKPLIEGAMAAAKDESFDTVGFIWMQGESDANNRLSEVYEESFLKLVGQLRKDLKREDLYYVIGRINDYARSRSDNAHWHRVREAQVKLGKIQGNAWIDTDNLNGGDADNPDGDIHFPRDGAEKLGQRFAKKAIELISKRPTRTANELKTKEEE